MHVEPVRFDRVFDVVKRTGDFSFETGGKRVYGVRLPKRMIPNEGETYLIAFETPGDFTTVLGWSKPGSGRMVVEDERPIMGAIASFDILTIVVAAILATGLSRFGKLGLIAAAFTLPVVLVVRLFRRRRGIRRALGGAAPTGA